MGDGLDASQNSRETTEASRLLTLFLIQRPNLDRLNVLCLETLGAAHDVELNALCFLKAAEAIGVDRREVNEDVFVVAIASDESKALGVVEPLDNTLFHDWCSFSVLIRLKISR